MSDIFIFDVPIYRTAETSYYADRKSYVDDRLRDYYDYPEPSRSEAEAFLRENPRSKIRYIDDLEIQYGGPWRFNDIIGYIRLYLKGYQVNGQLWHTRAKRVIRNPRHRILICKNGGLGIGMPVDIQPQSSNCEIFKRIIEYLDSVRPRFKNRFIDSSLLETVGPHVDYRSLIKKSIAS